MNTKHKIVAAIICIIIILMTISVIDHIQYNNKKSQLKKLKAGMSKLEVQDIIGKPSRIIISDDIPNKERWLYPTPIFVSDVLEVEFLNDSLTYFSE